MMTGQDTCAPLCSSSFHIDNDVIVAPTNSMQYLGVIQHYKLNWLQQWNLTIKRGSAWTSAIAQIMKSKMGIKTQFARQLYTAVYLPRMLYAAELWVSPQRG